MCCRGGGKKKLNNNSTKIELYAAHKGKQKIEQE